MAENVSPAQVKRSTVAAGDLDYARQLAENGYAVVKGVFGPDDIALLAAESDRLKAQGLKYGASFRHGNVLYLIVEDPTCGPVLRFMQWPAYVSEVLARYRVDPRLLAHVKPLIGDTLKQVIHQLIWKTPGATNTEYGFHQDCRFRRPASAFRNLGQSMVNSGIAIDPHGPENGCMRILPASHRDGRLALRADASVYQSELDTAMLEEVGLDPAGLVDLVLEPGDLALWSPYLVHGSGQNRSSGDRRFFVNHYMVASDCDRGEWAFRDGVPCSLGEPTLVQYEGIAANPEPHYVSGPPNPYVPEDGNGSV